MAQVPAGAQLSDDGQWWWDGTQWQPVPDPNAAAAATSAAASSATETPTTDPAGATVPTSSQGIGQLSEDGQWRWDGTQWQPVEGPAPSEAGGGAAGSDPGSAQQPDAQDADTPVQWDFSNASTGAVYTLNEQPDSQQSDEQQA